MTGRVTSGEAFGLPRSTQYDVFDAAADDQSAIFGGLPAREQRILDELLEMGELRKERTDRRGRGMFGAPAWYGEFCDNLIRACARAQLSELEAEWLLNFHYRLLMAEMAAGNLWRKPRGRNGRRRPRRIFFRYRNVRCKTCSGLVGPFTGSCHHCHFDGRWPRADRV